MNWVLQKFNEKHTEKRQPKHVPVHKFYSFKMLDKNRIYVLDIIT